MSQDGNAMPQGSPDLAAEHLTGAARNGLSNLAERACYFVSHIVSPDLDLDVLSGQLSVWASTKGAIDRDQYLANLRASHGLWSSPLTMSIDQVVQKYRCVVVISRSHGVFIGGETYTNEYLFVIDFDEDDRIRSIREYFDHDRVERIYRPAVARLRGAS